MELRQVKETMKELGLDRHHNPVAKNGITLANTEELVSFTMGLIRQGIERTGICYRANIFILNGNGTFTMIYNSFGKLNIGKDLDKGFVAGFAQKIHDEDYVVIYETGKQSYAVLAQD